MVLGKIKLPEEATSSNYKSYADSVVEGTHLTYSIEVKKDGIYMNLKSDDLEKAYTYAVENFQ